MSGCGGGSDAPQKLRVVTAGKLASREKEKGALVPGTPDWIPTPGQSPGERQPLEPGPGVPSSTCGRILAGRVNITFLKGLRCFV